MSSNPAAPRSSLSQSIKASRVELLSIIDPYMHATLSTFSSPIRNLLIFGSAHLFEKQAQGFHWIYWRSCKEGVGIQRRIEACFMVMDFRALLLVLAATVVAFSASPAVFVDDSRSLGSFEVPAIFAFGASLADAATNNFLPQATARADFPPYGKTFFKKPTGRFTNGRNAVDFVGKLSSNQLHALRLVPHL